MHEAQRIAIAVVERQGRYLIGQRPPGVPLAGLWEFPGGKVEPGETLEQAAVRECQEEAQVTVIVLGEYPAVEHEYAHGRVELHFFRCRPVDLALPHAPYRWVARGELGAYEFPAANRELVARLIQSSNGD